MARFTNQAQLSYNDSIINSNVTVGEILEVLSATKTAVSDDYVRGDDVTYVISVVNSGPTPLSQISIADDLGGYEFGELGTLYPLTYTPGSAQLYINGVLQSAPTVEAGPPLVFSGINIPASGNAVIVYEVTANQFAPLAADSTITNTATVSGAGAPVTASETISTEDAPDLTITKSMEPSVITDQGNITYTFLIQNTGSSEAVATDNVSVSDVFNPALSDITVTLNGTPLTAGTDYTYDEASGTFATTPSVITVPAASFEQDPASGAWIVTPGVSVLSVSGVI